MSAVKNGTTMYDRAEEIPLHNQEALEHAIQMLKWWYAHEHHKGLIPIVELWIRVGKSRLTEGG